MTVLRINPNNARARVVRVIGKYAAGKRAVSAVLHKISVAVIPSKYSFKNDMTSSAGDEKYQWLLKRVEAGDKLRKSEIKLAGLTEKQRIGLAKAAASQGNSWISRHISYYEIRDEQALIEIAKTAAAQADGEVSKYILNYGIKDEQAIIEIAKIAAAHASEDVSRSMWEYEIRDEISGLGFSRHLQNYGIKSEDALVEIAKIRAAHDGEDVSEFIKNYGVRDENARIEILKIAAKQGGFRFFRYIQNYGITREEILVWAAKTDAAHDGTLTSKYIQNYGIKNEQALTEIAEIAVAQSAGASMYIRNYGIRDEQARIRLARISALQSGPATRLFIQNYRIQCENLAKNADLLLMGLANPREYRLIEIVMPSIARHPIFSSPEAREILSKIKELELSRKYNKDLNLQYTEACYALGCILAVFNMINGDAWNEYEISRKLLKRIKRKRVNETLKTLVYAARIILSMNKKGFKLKDVNKRYLEDIIGFINRSENNLAENIACLELLNPGNAALLFRRFGTYCADFRTSLVLPRLFSRYAEIADSKKRREYVRNYSQYRSGQVYGAEKRPSNLPEEVCEEADFLIVNSNSLTQERYKDTIDRYGKEIIPRPNYDSDFSMELAMIIKHGYLTDIEIEFLKARVVLISQAIQAMAAEGSDSDIDAAIKGFPPTDKAGEVPSPEHLIKYFKLLIQRNYMNDPQQKSMIDGLISRMHSISSKDSEIPSQLFEVLEEGIQQADESLKGPLSALFRMQEIESINSSFTVETT
jgi:hypothetical protein